MLRFVFTVAAIFLQTMAASTVLGQDSKWWHGSYVPDQSIQSCEATDMMQRYEAGGFFPHETYCEIIQETPIRDMEGVLLDIACRFSEGEELDGAPFRTLLLKAGDDMILTYPGGADGAGQRMLRCPVRDCTSGDGVWTSFSQDAVGHYRQELQFDNGAAEGSVTLTEYRDNRPAWVADGRWACSNGRSICYLQFPGVVSKEDFSFPFERVGRGRESYISVPSFSQRVFYAENTILTDQYAFTGLSARLLDG
ncbi:MAG: hypothetical protein WD005_04710, partial [Haliea sp.]